MGIIQLLKHQNYVPIIHGQLHFYVDDSGIKYYNELDINHLLKARSTKYATLVDWYG